MQTYGTSQKTQNMSANDYRNVHFEQRYKKIHNGEKIESLTKGAGKSGCQMQKNKIDPYLSPCTKINSKRMKYFNVKPEMLKQLKENRQHPISYRYKEVYSESDSI